MATDYQPADLVTERLHLKLASQGDAQLLYSLFNDPACVANTTMAQCQSLKQAEAILFQMLSDGQRWWFIHLGSNLEMVGLVGFNQLKVPQIGFTVKPDWRRQGYCSEALGAVLAYGHHVEGLDKYEALTHPLNQATIKILEKHGFICYGSTWQYYPNEGKVMGSKVYGLSFEYLSLTSLPPDPCESVILLPSKSLERSLMFYQSIGFSIDFVQGYPPHYAAVSLGIWSCAKTRIHFTHNEQMCSQNSCAVYLIVGQMIETLYKLCKEAPAPITQELEHITSSTVQFTIQDPDGHRLVFRNYT